MKTKERPLTQKKSKFPMTAEERDIAVVAAMSKALDEEYRRWNMPFIVWRDGRIVEDWSWKEDSGES